MKKILFTLMLLLSCMMAAWAEETPLTKDANGYYLVSNARELQRAVKSELSADGLTSYSKIRLTANIYLSELPAETTTTLNNTFSGTIDGTYTFIDSNGVEKNNGYTIYGGHENEFNDRFKTRTCYYLFTYLKGATFLNIRFAHIAVKSDDRDNQAIIASQAWDSKFQYVFVDSCYVFCDENYAGIVVGKAYNCEFETVVNNVSHVVVYGQYSGGLAGYSESCQYTTCVTSKKSSVYADGSNTDNHAYCGGFVGYSKFDKFDSCLNMALVGVEQNQAGGFTGYSDNSNFYNCKNTGMVTAVPEEADFDNLRRNLNAHLENTALVSAGSIAGLVIGATILTFSWLDIACAASAVLVLPGGILIAIAAFALTYTVVHVMNGDDEIGGIAGLAVGGNFELCSNFGYTRCPDENGGGIVGLGYGVTINNCYNGGTVDYNEESKGGAIIGSALAAKSGKMCKVTNCCSSIAYHLIGDTEGLDPASGNNYRISDNGQTESTWCEMTVDTLKMRTGVVALWLNQSAENRESKPWRQKLTCDPTNPNDTIIDLVPCLEPSHPEIKFEDLEYTEISDAAGLKAYAKSVNSGNQFDCAVLTADIDMKGETWTPIGKDLPNRHFRGIFDGRGHTISGLECSSDSAVGLFGAVHSNAEIRNVLVKDANFSCSTVAGAGGIVGEVKIGWKWGNVTIENCGSYADVNVSGERHAGGILGNIDVLDNTNNNIKTYVTNCFSMGTVTAGYGNSALICGYAKNSGVIRNCWSSGQLRNGDNKKIWPYSKDNFPNDTVAEYLVGFNKDLDIKNCYLVNPTDKIDRYGEYPLQPGVAIVNEESLTNGRLTYKLNGYYNYTNKAWQQNLGTDTIPMFGNRGVFHTRDISNQYGTVCLPYQVDSDDEIQYYTFTEATTSEGETLLKFDYADRVPAGKAALFHVAKTGETEFKNPHTSVFDDFIYSGGSDWEMKGTYEKKVFEDPESKTIYYVSDGKIKNGKKVTIAPFRAYFVGPSIETLTGSNAKHVRIVIDDIDGGAMSLPLVVEDRISCQNGKSYTLYGTEAGQGYRGIMIRDGKKVMR